jgi:chaperone modulatory protein CbpM
MTETLFRISFNELCELEGIESHLVVQVVEYGIVRPVNKDVSKDAQNRDEWNWLFDTKGVPWIKTAVRLHQDLEIDWVAVAMVVELMQQKQALQEENEAFQRQLSRFIKSEIH